VEIIKIYQLDFSGKLNLVGEVEGGINMHESDMEYADYEAMCDAEAEAEGRAVEGEMNINKCDKCIIQHAECIAERKTIKINDNDEVIECSGFVGEGDGE